MSSLGFTRWTSTQRPPSTMICACFLENQQIRLCGQRGQCWKEPPHPQPQAVPGSRPPASHSLRGRDTWGVKGPLGGPPGRARRPGEGAWPPLSVRPGRCFPHKRAAALWAVCGASHSERPGQKHVLEAWGSYVTVSQSWGLFLESEVILVYLLWLWDSHLEIGGNYSTGVFTIKSVKLSLSANAV